MFEEITKESLVRKYKFHIQHHAEKLVDAKLAYQLNPSEDTEYDVKYHFRKYNEAIDKIALLNSQFSKIRDEAKENVLLEWALR